MSPDAHSLLARLEAYSPDDPASAFPFSAKLAKECGWSRSFAQRVIIEYKRFAYLAMTADHVAAPSDQVDQAWHLHLTYTRSYWEEFCGKVLGKPLHHEPSKGGRPEDHKFRDLYLRTLESYHSAFGAAPPSDIWPPVEIRFGEDIRFIRVNRTRHWIIPKPRQLARSLHLIALAAPFLTLVGCGSAAIAVFNPFDLRGPEFLRFYLGLSVFLFGAAMWLRWWLRKPTATGTSLKNVSLTPYESAMLAGGNLRVVTSAVAILVRRQEVAMHERLNGPTDFESLNPPAASAHPLEHATWAMIHESGPLPLRTLVGAMESYLEPISASLESKGWLTGVAVSRQARLIPALVAALVPLIGTAKICVGLYRDKPVGFLVVGVLITALAPLLLFARRPYRSRAGDALLQKLRADHPDLQTPSAKFQASYSDVGTALPMGVALFGASALVNAGLFPLENAMGRSGGLGAINGNYGCGAGTSGCGAGCGGGGGCGGGCGGCGGGG